LEKAVTDYTIALQKSLPKLNALKRKHAEVKIKTLAAKPG
jgi:hypothetical protein